MDQDLIDRWFDLGPIRWGLDDCVPLVASEVKRRTGIDPLAAYRDADGLMPYRTEAERDGYVARMGGNLLRLVLRGLSARHDVEAVRPVDAPVGAVGIAEMAGEWPLGMHAGHGWFLFRGEVGAIVLQGQYVRRAWTWLTDT